MLWRCNAVANCFDDRIDCYARAISSSVVCCCHDVYISKPFSQQNGWKKPLKNVRKKSSHEVQNAYEMLLISRHRDVCAVGRHFNHCVSAEINFWYLFSHRKSFIIWSIDDVTKISMKSKEEEKKINWTFLRYLLLPHAAWNGSSFWNSISLYKYSIN